MADPFSPSAIALSVHASLDAALAEIPPDHSGALLFHASDRDHQIEIGGVLAQRLGDDWRFAVGGQWTAQHGLTADVALVGSWK